MNAYLISGYYFIIFPSNKKFNFMWIEKIQIKRNFVSTILIYNFRFFSKFSY